MAIDNLQQIKLIGQALAAARNSLELAQQLLGELQGRPKEVSISNFKPVDQRLPVPTVARVAFPAREVPGIVGTFDGQNLLTASGEKYKVPENYASKTGLVFGDKLKMVDPPLPAQAGFGEENKGPFFKQIERVKRQRVEGVLSQSEKGWKLVTADGPHTVLEAAVKHFGGEVGTEMYGLLPKDQPHASFAALEGLVKPPAGVGTANPEVILPVVLAGEDKETIEADAAVKKSKRSSKKSDPNKTVPPKEG